MVLMVTIPSTIPAANNADPRIQLRIDISSQLLSCDPAVTAGSTFSQFSAPGVERNVPA
jgi:hypothetical protein